MSRELAGPMSDSCSRIPKSKDRSRSCASIVRNSCRCLRSWWIAAIKAMDLATLEQETIGFGKAHLRQPFPQAFEDHGWTDWFVKSYEWSGKESHVKYLTYVEKRLDHKIAQEQQNPVQPKAMGQESSCEAQVHSTELREKSRMDPSDRGCDRIGFRHRADDSDGHQSERHGGEAATCVPGECGHEPTDEWHRDGTSRTDFEEREDDQHDFVFVAPTSQNMSYNQKVVVEQVNMFLKEYEEIRKNHQTDRSSRMDLFEVMCHEQSELTHQAELCGLRARHFDIGTTDLSTEEVRHILFIALITQRPEHVWYSPECGPWCLWSNLNMGKSFLLEEKILNLRESKLWQIALGIVIHRHQRQLGKHFQKGTTQGVIHVETTRESGTHTKHVALLFRFVSHRKFEGSWKYHCWRKICVNVKIH